MVLSPCACLIITERVALVLRVTSTERIDETEIGDPAQRRSGFRLEQRIAGPRFRIVTILESGNHVVIAHDEKRLLECEQLLRMPFQTIEPCELVLESL